MCISCYGSLTFARLFGSGDSIKSTILKQMHLIHRVPFSLQETEHFRQFGAGLRYLCAARRLRSVMYVCNV
jgi:hypothetical protein